MYHRDVRDTCITIERSKLRLSYYRDPCPYDCAWSLYRHRRPVKIALVDNAMRKHSPQSLRLTKRPSAAVDGSPSKRVKRDQLSSPSKGPSPRRAALKQEIPDSDAESDAETFEREKQPLLTSLERALPAINTDKEAIQEYEALRAAGTAFATERDERLGQMAWVKGKSSIYVDAFNLTFETVLEEESHLFNEPELQVFEAWRGLSYEAQYLYVRLFLRKTAAWHRINKLGYYGDIADLEKAARELFQSRTLAKAAPEEQINPGEHSPPEGTTLEDLFAFADDSAVHISTLEEASSLLLLDELKVIAKDAKVQGKNKTELLRSFRRTSGKQTALDFSKLARTETSESYTSDGGVSREASPLKNDGTTSGNRDAHFVDKIMAETGQCIRLSLATFKLFERVHLVFYRSSEWTEKSLTTIILARIARRNFPEYLVSRSGNIFSSRSLLLEFEASIRTQFRVDSILEFSGRPTREALQTILDITDEVLPRWRILLKDEQRKEDSVYLDAEGAYLRRLSPAWVYTRILHKGAYVLSIAEMKNHEREHSLLSELLAQRLFHSTRRGAWYQRKALLEEHYMCNYHPTEGRSSEEQKKKFKRIALKTCEDGLQDNLVHLIHHYDLQKRITKLERTLKIPKRLQHEFSHVRLTQPLERVVKGVRIERQPLITTNSQPRHASLRRQSSTDKPIRRGAKTIWLDPATPEPHTECSVEAMCLSWYRSQGWKGFHSEGGILRTLFALLMYDVLFIYVPNVFQTPFQTCPLDLHTDAFADTRASELNRRLAEIENGGAERIVQQVWEAHAERKTCVIGLDWAFELGDLREIARCFDGAALAAVVKVMAEDYASRGGGVPDLFLWDVQRKNGKGEVCFAEVKSENDRLSDTQRLWIHILAGAGVKVELCAAVASDVRVVN